MTAPQEPVRDHPRVRSAVFMDEAATRDAIRWAQTYNGYQRLAQDPGRLGTLLEPARHEYLRTGHVPEWCGVDLLRGWGCTAPTTSVGVAPSTTSGWPSSTR